MTQRVRWKLGDREIEVEGTDKFIKAQLKIFFEGLSSREPPRDSAENQPGSKAIGDSRKPTRAPSPAELIKQKRPKSGTETVTTLARYLDEYRQVQEFAQKDINKLAGEAKLKKIHPQYFTDAVKQGYLRTVGKGKYAITMTGEELVDSIPTREGRE